MAARRHIALVLALLACSWASAATYYVRASGGNDANDGLSFANGWATLQKGFNTILAGDTLYVCGDFTISAPVNVDMNGGVNPSPTVTAPISVLGADASGTPHAGTGRSVIGTATNSLDAIMVLYPAADWFVFRDLDFDAFAAGTKATNAVASSADGSDMHRFINCVFRNARLIGMAPRGTLEEGWAFVGCRFTANGTAGLSGPVSNRGSSLFVGCRFDNNGTVGASASGSGGNVRHRHFYSIFHNNASHGYSHTGTAVPGMVYLVSCTSYGNGGDGFSIGASLWRPNIINCTAANNGGYGYNFAGRNVVELASVRANHAHNNTSGATDINGGVMPGTGNVTGDPLFRNTTAGSEDFTPAYNSPLRNAGYPSGDIGAVQRNEALPVVGDVRTGTGYGAWINELVGTMAAGGGGGPRVGDRTGGLR